MSSIRLGDGCCLPELFKMEQHTETPHTSNSFEDRSTYLTIEKLPGFDKEGKSYSLQYPSNAFRGKIANVATVARFSLKGKAPRLTDAIILAERVHAALVELSDGSATFTGCDEEGRPLSGHAHAYFLCESNLALGRGRSGEITHASVYAPAGFGPQEIAALEALTEVGGSGLEVQLTLLALGEPRDFGGTDAARGESPLLAESRSWTSRTPFIPTRHP